MSRYRETAIQESDLMDRYRDRAGKIMKYATTLYGEIDERDDDLHVLTQEGDRLDLLAQQFYNDRDLWWFIGRVNNLNTMNVPAGTQLRIPVSTNKARGT